MCSVLKRWLAAVACCMVFGQVHAGVATAGAPSWTYPSARTAVIAESGTLAQLIQGRTYTPNGSFAVGLSDLLKMPLTSANILGTSEVAFVRTVGASAVNAAIADAIAVAVVGVAAYEIATAVRCKALGAGATGCDDGQAPTQDYVYSWYYRDQQTPYAIHQGFASSAAAAAKLSAQAADADNTFVSGATTYKQVTTVGNCTETASSYSCAATYTRTSSSAGCGGTCVSTFTDTAVYGGNRQLGSSCPAVTDPANPANNIAAGSPIGPDGKCPTGRYVSKTKQEVADKVGEYANAAKRVEALRQFLESGGKVETLPGALSGPETVSGAPTTQRITGPAGVTTTTTTPRTRFRYDGEGVTATDDPIVVTGNPDGTTTTTEGPPAKIDIETCGLPGKPPCKIDETGTPTSAPTAPDTPDKLKSEDAAKRDAAIASIQDPGFGWIGAPPVAQCTPFDWPTMGRTFTLDPCGPMEQIRSVMAYVWALFAAWWSFGMIRKTVTGA